MLAWLLRLSVAVVFIAWFLPDEPSYSSEPTREFWGEGEPVLDDDEIRPFSIEISEEKVEEFKWLLKRSRSRPKRTFFHNFLARLEKVMLDFDWTQHQRFLNTFKQYTTEVEGLKLHFIRTSIPPPKSADVVPLVLLHGVPGSFWEFYKMIPVLSNPSRYGFDFGPKRPLLFDVIVPSLPGFMFSDKPQYDDMTIDDMARIMKKLFERLGLEKYVIHAPGGLAAGIASRIASISMHGDQLLGLHLSNPFISPLTNWKVASTYLVSSFVENSTSIFDVLSNSQKYSENYDQEAFESALRNSPSGLASYLMRRWRQLSTPEERTQLDELFTLDEMATVVYLYWLTESTDYAVRDVPTGVIGQIEVPTAILFSPQAPWRTPTPVMKRQFNISTVTNLEKGGLFCHLQAAEAVTADIFRFVERLLL